MTAKKDSATAERRVNAYQWLVLDNLRSGWPYHTNMSRKNADAAVSELTSSGHIDERGVTSLGLVALMLGHKREKATP